MSKPSASSSSASQLPRNPSFGVRKRKRKIQNASFKPDFNRALDEGDDVGEDDLEDARSWRVRRNVDEDYDEEGEGGDEYEGVQEEDGEGDEAGEGEGEAGEDREEADLGGGGNEGAEGPDAEVGPSSQKPRGRRKGLDRGPEENVDVEDGGRRQEEIDEEERGKRMLKLNKRFKGDQLLIRGILDPDQAKRFDAFQTVVVPRKAISSINRELFDQRVAGTDTLPMIAGMTKIFITEVIELAKDLQPHSAIPAGPLQPYHLRLAREELERKGLLSGMNRTGGTGTALTRKKALFRR